MSPKEALIAHIKKNGKDMPWTALTKKFNPKANPDWSRQTLRANGFNINSGEFTVDNKIANSKVRLQSEHHRKENGELVKRVIDLENDLTLALAVKGHKVKTLNIPPPSRDKVRHQATAVIQWSDWHVDELVDKNTINGLNEYNPEIVRKRASKLFENSIKLTNTQRGAVDIEHGVLHLGGDFIGGYIHPELEQTNTMSPLEGIWFSIDLITSGINYILEHGGFKRIIAVCSRGNHPRLTKKMQFANDYSMNLEMFLYKTLAHNFSGDKRIEFVIEQGDLSYFNIYDYTCRFFHGHQIKFQGGIGGMTIPLYKAIHRWNDTKKAYYNFMCDKHTYSNPVPDCQVNGSLKGYDAFASSLGFKFQPPLQSFTLIDSKYGVTIKAPIHCI